MNTVLGNTCKIDIKRQSAVFRESYLTRDSLISFEKWTILQWKNKFHLINITLQGSRL